MTAATIKRAARRSEDQDNRDRERRLRGLALRTAAVMADQDPTVSGFMVIMPDGSTEFVDAATLRRGGRA
jgi:hypothetical protein